MQIPLRPVYMISLGERARIHLLHGTDSEIDDSSLICCSLLMQALDPDEDIGEGAAYSGPPEQKKQRRSRSCGERAMAIATGQFDALYMSIHALITVDSKLVLHRPDEDEEEEEEEAPPAAKKVRVCGNL
jgi:hypothetical protein